MGNFIKFKERAKELRAGGYMFREICGKLGIVIPRSTLSNWFRGIALPEAYRKRIKKFNIQQLQKGRFLRIAKLKKENELLSLRIAQENSEIVKKIDSAVGKLLLSILYLAEGSKRKGALMLGSSDPGIINLFLNLLERCYGIKRDAVRCRVSYRSDQNIKVLNKFWSKNIKIPLSRFYKTIPDPRTIGKATKKKDYKGVCVVYIVQTSKIKLELTIIASMLCRGR